MISRTKSAVSGMVMSVLLAGHAFAAHPMLEEDAATAPKAPTVAVEHKKLAPSRVQSARRGMRRAAKPAAEVADGRFATLMQRGRFRQTGIASWYGGRRWEGHRTASGERYNEYALTAAHATLPLGSQVRVDDQRTGKSVVVTINDRPGTRRRVIDLSYEAAKRLGMADHGIDEVTLTELGPPAERPMQGHRNTLLADSD